MMGFADLGKPRTDVEKDAKFVYQWLSQDKSALRDFLSASSDGAGFFTANVHAKVAVSYVKHRQDSTEGVVGILESEFVNAAVCRLCD